MSYSFSSPGASFHVPSHSDITPQLSPLIQCQLHILPQILGDTDLVSGPCTWNAHPACSLIYIYIFHVCQLSLSISFTPFPRELIYSRSIL